MDNKITKEGKQIFNRILKNQRVFKNSAYLTTSTFLMKASILGLFLVATRVLSQDEMGQYVIVTNLFAILQPALTFGMQAFISKEVAKDINFARTNFSVLLFIQVLMACLSVCGLICFLFFSKYGQNTILIIIYFVPVFLLFGPLYLVDAIFLGLEDARLSSTFQVLLNVSLFLIGSGALIITRDLRALAVSYFISYFVVTTTSFIFLYRRLGGYELRRFKLKSVKSFIFILFPFATVSFLDAIKNRVDVLLLSNLVPLDQLAIYGAAYRIFDGVRTFTSYPFSMAAYPRMSALCSSGRKKSKIYKEFSITAGSIGFIVSIALFLSSNLIVGILYPDSYSPAIIILKLVAISIFFDSVNAISGRFLFILDKPWLVSWGVLIAASINIISNLFLIPLYSIGGAAVATDITYFIYFCYLVLVIIYQLFKEKDFRVSLSDL